MHILTLLWTLTVLAVTWAVAAVFAGIALAAMVWGHGNIELRFNEYHEGWAEVAILLGLVVLYPLALWRIRRS